jgi:hypothetical protein
VPEYIPYTYRPAQYWDVTLTAQHNGHEGRLLPDPHHFLSGLDLQDREELRNKHQLIQGTFGLIRGTLGVI